MVLKIFDRGDHITMGKNAIYKYLLRLATFFGGLYIVATGIVSTIQANLGVNPWDVLHIGLSIQTGLTIGRIIQIVGLMLVGFSFFMKVKPSIGTILNMVFLGFFVDLIMYLDYIPSPDLLWHKVVLFITGVALFGFGCAIYISANIGAGPRDSLMLALGRIIRRRLGTIRTFMEVTAALIGYFLGGPLGLGTLIFALTVGFFMDLGFALIRLFKHTIIYKTLVLQQPH